MLIGVLLAINIVVCLGLIGVVLLQRSEGGALGMGGGNSGFMTARGAGDLLTRLTWILFSVFLLISLTLTILTGRANTGGSVADQVKGLDAKSLNAAPAPVAPPPGSLNSLPASPDGQPGTIQAPTPQINAPAPAAAQPSLLAPTEAKKPAPAPKAAAKPAEKPAAAAPTPTVAAPPAEQPKQ